MKKLMLLAVVMAAAGCVQNNPRVEWTGQYPASGAVDHSGDIIAFDGQPVVLTRFEKHREIGFGDDGRIYWRPTTNAAAEGGGR